MLTEHTCLNSKAAPTAFAFRSLAIMLVVITSALTAPAQADTISSSAAFAVRNGSVLNPIGVPGIFGGPSQDEAFVEFDLDFGGCITNLSFDFEARDFTGLPTSPGDNFDVYIYAGNGQEDVSDFGSGTFLTTLQNDTQLGNTAFSLDVTTAAANLAAGGATHIGFRFTNVDLNDQLNLISPTLETTPGPGIVAVPAQAATIQAALSLPTNPVCPAIIEVAPGNYVENLDLTPLVGASGAVILRSSGGAAVTTLDGSALAGLPAIQTNGAAAAFEITLEGFTITGAASTTDGGGLRVTGGTQFLTVRDCVFDSNTSTGFGGGMYVQGGNAAQIVDCDFLGNDAPSGGGGLFVVGGATVNGTDFLQNTSGFGAGVNVQVGSPSFTDCTFDGNIASSNGGGMDIAFGALPVLTNCDFLGNQAFQGGAIQVFQAGVQISGTTFTTNSATFGGGVLTQQAAGVQLDDCTFGGDVANANTAVSSGGAAYFFEPAPSKADTTGKGPRESTSGSLRRLTASPAAPGVEAAIESPNKAGDVVLTDCNITANDATGAGGGIVIDRELVDLTGVTLEDNTAGDSGGGIWNLNAATATLTRCTLRGNSAAFGGGMLSSALAVSVVNLCDFESNVALGDGGGFEAAGAGATTIADSRFFANVAQGDVASGGAPPFLGGAIAVFGGQAPFIVGTTLVANQMTGPDPTDGGGGIGVAQGHIDIANSILWGNTAAAAASTEQQQLQQDASLAPPGTATVLNSTVQGLDTFAGNGNSGLDPTFENEIVGDLRLACGSPAIDGGALVGGQNPQDLDGEDRVQGASVDQGPYERRIVLQPAIDAAPTFPSLVQVEPGEYCEAIDFLGKPVLLASTGGASVTTINATGKGTSAVKFVSGEDPNTLLAGFTIKGGSGDTADFADPVGGGVYIAGSSPVVNDCIFEGNDADFGAGAFVNAGTTPSNPVFSNCSFEANTGGSGGGLYVFGGATKAKGAWISGPGRTSVKGSSLPTLKATTAWNDQSEPPSKRMSTTRLERCSFTANLADFGAGVFVDAAITSIEACDFENNVATGDGGGVLVLTGGSADLVNSRFFANSAQGDAAASGGIAPFGGGAIAVQGGDAQIHNCTLVNNSMLGTDPTDGGGGIISYFEGNVDVFNSILWGNTALQGTLENQQFRIATFQNPPPTGSIQYSDIEGFNSFNTTLAPGPNIGADPRFVDLPGGNLRPVDLSPVINSGNDASVPSGVFTDLDGNFRFIGLKVDMGAYEFTVPTSVEDAPVATQGSSLRSVYPNPFNPRVTITFALDRESPVRVTVHDLRGLLVATLDDGVRPAGTHDVVWNGSDDHGRTVASGSYVVTVEANGQRDHRTMTLVK